MKRFGPDLQYENLDAIPWGALTALEAAEAVKLLTPNDPLRRGDFEMLRKWILKGYHLDIGIYNARVALADAERTFKEDTDD